MIPQYNTVIFSDVFENLDTFLEEYHNSQFPQLLEDKNITILYYLLLARYGNTPIANNSIDQFILKVFSRVFQYGPAWVKKLDIQNELNNMSIAELEQGSKIIYNHAFNPSEGPYTSSLDELDYINDQNTANYKKSKIQALEMAWSMIDVNATDEFLRRFKDLFKVFTLPDLDYIYGGSDECQ